MDALAMQDLKSIIAQSMDQSISASDYETLLHDFAKSGKTSGTKQNEDLIHYTKLNAQRGKRINKTWQLDDLLVKEVKRIQDPQQWIVLTESWCGDAANAIPILARLAELNEQISLQVVFRDENLPLMDQFLTNGGRSIPKLLALDQNLDVLYTWGPRPKEAQTLYMNWRNSEDKIPYSEFHVILQKWYNEDAGKAMQKELLELMSK
ncbi:MAG: thioredoxin family protein [Bacteroidota bacterium]